MNKSAIYEAAIEKWGMWHQMMKAVEEMSELMQELCKQMAGEGNRARTAEELADVLITLEQVQLACGIEEEVGCWKGIKLKRLEERIREE